MSVKFLLLLPFLEIIIFILFGDLFGFLNVIFFILVSGVLGIFILFPKSNLETLSKISENPIDWVCKRLAGFLLIIPGFITDLFGILLLIKVFRTFLFNFIPENIKKENRKAYEKRMSETNVIDAEYKNLDD